jgi:uncharacterized protein YmfQ (DUF2313 family)
MPLYNLQSTDFAALLTKLQPTGDAWPTDADSVLQQSLAALAEPFSYVNARANNLVTDAFPSSTVELLPEWEASLGLPDSCTPLGATIQQRQRAVVAKLVGRGGQSVPYFISVAAALGYTITITQFTAFTFGMPFGLPLAGLPWSFTWQVNAASITIQHFLFGHDAFGQPFETFGNNVLICELTKIAPAHTTLIFSFS